MKHKYQLDPSSKKFACPACEKRRFVRMIDELGNYISHEFGRCDRSSSCGYYLYPQSSDTTIKIDVSLCRATLPSFKSGPPSTIPYHYVEQSLKGYNKNTFYLYLSKTYDKIAIAEVFKIYRVGTAKKWNGSTIFWQINSDLAVRTGKIIKFDPLNGKRVKEPNNLTTWVHSLLAIKEFNLKQVLFGEHLLNLFPDKVVCIVESEKTAIIMALKHPNYLWLSTSGKNGLTADKLSVFKNRIVVVFPDSDAFDEWNEKAKLISKQINLDLIVSNFILNCTIAIDPKNGFDLADLNQINIDYANSKKLNDLTENINLNRLIQRNPYLSKLIQVFDLVTFNKST